MGGEAWLPQQEAGVSLPLTSQFQGERSDA